MISKTKAINRDKIQSMTKKKSIAKNKAAKKLKNTNTNTENNQPYQAELIAQMTSMHQGPIPDPRTLQSYEELCPGATDRIIAMAEENAKHHHKATMATLQLEENNQENEKEVAKLYFKDRKTGFNYGAILFAVCLLASIGFFFIQYNFAGTIFISVTMLSVIMKFIPTKQSIHNDKDNTDSSEE